MMREIQVERGGEKGNSGKTKEEMRERREGEGGMEGYRERGQYITPKREGKGVIAGLSK